VTVAKSAATALVHAMASTKNIRKRAPVKQSDAGEIDKLADELFTRVQRPQGQAFISDGWSGAKDKASFLEWVQDRPDWNEEASKQLRAFLKKHKRS
jgi:hypothetical protein